MKILAKRTLGKLLARNCDEISIMGWTIRIGKITLKNSKAFSRSSWCLCYFKRFHFFLKFCFRSRPRSKLHNWSFNRKMRINIDKNVVTDAWHCIPSKSVNHFITNLCAYHLFTWGVWLIGLTMLMKALTILMEVINFAQIL